jgi:hypothetical protein
MLAPVLRSDQERREVPRALIKRCNSIRSIMQGDEDKDKDKDENLLVGVKT